MVDFVAVIRKAVDGLSSNTSENRAKVYEKARGAVVRQLENMKPLPSEALLARQLAKLDAAVAEVENEYAEALPPLDEAAVAGAASRPRRPAVEDYSTYFQNTDPIDASRDAPFLQPAAGGQDKPRSAWDDLDDHIGYGDQNAGGAPSHATEEPAPGIVVGVAANAYRVRKPRRNYAALILSLCGMVLLAGGAFAVWMNRDALNDMVGGLIQSAQTASPSTQQAGAIKAEANGQPAVASGDDGSVRGTKFTQRLLANGTERDEGPGQNGQPATAEGQSVYQQKEAPADGERMFLYEEELGQAVPTAVPGSVAWSLQSELGADSNPSPTVQGQVSIPGRGLSALITFKRNSDASLPASHLVEVVFSVSPHFEGGAIDSVQRIAMKSTEQDSGNALIAVPAKITDDFHMIALNDFPDALKTNLELLRNRDWIDIPVSYRNGRRALLTMQKGPAGKAAFDTALGEWTAATPAAKP